MKELLERCTACGGELTVKKIERTLTGGDNAALVEVEAESCSSCGEIYLTPPDIERFEEIRAKLKSGDLSGFRIVGKTVRVA